MNCAECRDTGMIPDPDRGSGWGPYWDTRCECNPLPDPATILASLREVAATDPESVLATAERLVGGDRSSSYGHPADHAQKVAALWAAAFGWEATPHRVHLAMVLFKLARSDATPEHKDSLTDIAGYARTAEATQARAGVEGFVDL